MNPPVLTAFGLSIPLIWHKIDIPDTGQVTHTCNSNEFYLAIPGVARFLVDAKKNHILIEKAQDDVPMHIINTWLMGTVMAYLLQYQNYLVLHGSAVLINGHAVVFSGQSGAGKSTLASALLKQGYPFITDDLVVIKQNTQGQYGIIPGPTYSKLWEDALSHLDHDREHAKPVNFKTNKFSIPVPHPCHLAFIPIAAFYELSVNANAITFTHEQLTGMQSLQTLMQNAYRYFMLKPLGKLQHFLNDCSQLAQHISVNKIIRRPDLSELSLLTQHIQLKQELV